MYDETIKMLNETKVPLKEIAEKTELKLFWLYRVKSGNFAEPGVRKIETLHKYLKDVDE